MADGWAACASIGTDDPFTSFGVRAGGPGEGAHGYAGGKTAGRRRHRHEPLADHPAVRSEDPGPGLEKSQRTTVLIRCDVTSVMVRTPLLTVASRFLAGSLTIRLPNSSWTSIGVEQGSESRITQGVWAGPSSIIQDPANPEGAGAGIPLVVDR